MADNERILRHLPYIRDARILAIPHPGNLDAVKIIVITQDKFPWGIIPEIADIARFGLGLSRSNVLRLGQQIYVGISINTKDTISRVGYKIVSCQA